jgi:hypothetical protein
MALRELRLRVPRSLIIEVVAFPLPLRSAVEGARYCEICFQIGLVFLILQSKFDEVDDSGCKPNCSDDDVDSIRARAIATDVLWGTALAAGITAGVLFFLEGRGGGSDETKKKDDDLKDLEEESDELVKSFKVTPLVGAGTYGLGADIRF